MGRGSWKLMVWSLSERVSGSITALGIGRQHGGPNFGLGLPGILCSRGNVYDGRLLPPPPQPWRGRRGQGM